MDPLYLAEVEIERYRRENTATALREMRVGRGLRPSDIPDVSVRHVRRIEQVTSRLTSGTTESHADVFDLPLEGFLEQLGGRLRELSGDTEPGRQSVGSVA